MNPARRSGASTPAASTATPRAGRAAVAVARRTLSLSLSLLVALLATPAWSADEKPAYVVPESVSALFAATGEDGKPVLSEKARAYFDALPERAKELVATAVADERIAGAAHLAVILDLEMTVQRFELFLQNNCVLCHADAEYQDAETLLAPDPKAAGTPAHMNLADAVNDIHFRQGIGCAGCHGGDASGFMEHAFPDQWPAERDDRQTDRSWIPGFCDRCHGDTDYMRQFNPGLPTDQLAKYRESHHGKLVLEQKDSAAAQCVSCHGVHGILGPKSPASRVNAKNIPETCGECHASAEHMAGRKLADGSPMPTNQLEEYKTSVHGRALLERDDLGAPACNDCHGNHSAMPPEVSSVSQICRTCHVANGSLFDGSKHKAAFEEHRWPECETCHGKHAIAKTDDAMLAVAEGTLCNDCHSEHAPDTPECKETAAYFHETIGGFTAARGHFTELTEELAERGVDTDPLHERLIALDDALKQTRSYIHSFERSEFDRVAKTGIETVAEMETLAESAESELDLRRRGLLVAMALTALLALALYLKLRRMERG